MVDVRPSLSCIAMAIVLVTTLLLDIRLSLAAGQPYIKLQIENSELYMGDTLVLDIESSGLLDPIDLSILETSAKFERETTGTRIAVVKGKVVEIAIRRMEFSPSAIGNIVLGPLIAGDVVSNSVVVQVKDAVRSNWQPQDSDIKIQALVSHSEAYIHSQITLDIELLSRFSVSDEQITLPEFDGFQVRQQFAERRTFTDETKLVRRIAWRYFLFPEKSGLLELGEIQWTGQVVASRNERAKFTRSSGIGRLVVLAAKNEGANWWLPAKSIRLTEAWSVPAIELKAGDEVTRTLKIAGEHILSSQIPEPSILESRALKQTLIHTQREENIAANGLYSTAEFVYRVKAQSPIPVFLDTVRIEWWNTVADTAADAIIPARRINIGLPDRADLLRDIAFKETGVSKLSHWFRTASLFRSTIYVVTLIVFLLALRYLIPILTSEVKRAYRLRRLKRKLRSLVRKNNWQELYAELVKLQGSGVVSGISDSVVVSLQHRLFSRHVNADSTVRGLNGRESQGQDSQGQSLQGQSLQAQGLQGRNPNVLDINNQGSDWISGITIQSSNSEREELLAPL